MGHIENSTSAAAWTGVTVLQQGCRTATPQAQSNGVSNDFNLAGHVTEERVRAIIARRRQRYDFFPQRLFADPAWDILLALTVAACRQHRVPVSKLCRRVDVPMTTALRWVKMLTDEGLLVRRDDSTDKRRKYLELSPGALSMMIAYCSATTAGGSSAA